MGDCARLLEAGKSAGAAPGRLVLVAMGDRGWTSRICAAKFGSLYPRRYFELDGMSATIWSLVIWGCAPLLSTLSTVKPAPEMPHAIGTYSRLPLAMSDEFETHEPG